MEKLIPVINKLQNVFNTVKSSQFNANLPQIVVVGEQSAGKSSVLESLVGRTCLPRGAGIVTRCPIVLQLIQLPPAAANVVGVGGLTKIKECKAISPSEYVEFPHLPKDQQRIEDFELIPAIINEEVVKRAGDSKNIISTELIMRIYSTDVITLTVVDLPGIVRNAVKGQPVDIEEQINRLVKKYIENENSIILAVSAATNDIATSTSIKLARSVDPEFKRTVAVITKLDLMDKGLDASDVLVGKTLSMKLGIVGVVSRSFQDTQDNLTITQSLEKEDKFFLDNYPKLAHKNGSKYLRNKLQKILMEHIKKTIPRVETDLKSKKDKAEEELRELGEEVPENKSEILLSLVEKLCESYKDEIQGTDLDKDSDILSGRARIALLLEEQLAEEIPEIDLDHGKILNTIRNSRPLDSSLIVTERSYQVLAKSQIKQLSQPAENCAAAVKDELVKIIHDCVTTLGVKLARFPLLAETIVAEVMELLNTGHDLAVKELRNYIETQASFIKTFRPEFNDAAEAFFRKSKDKDEESDDVETEERYEKPNPLGGFVSLTPASNLHHHHQHQQQNKKVSIKNQKGRKRGGKVSSMYSNLLSRGEDEDEELTEFQKDQCRAVEILVSKYYEIVKEAFLDYCPKVIAHNLIYKIMKQMQTTLVIKLHNEEAVSELVIEDDGVTQKRKNLRELIGALKKAEVVIREVKGIKW